MSAPSKKVAITTTSFGVHDSEALRLLEEAGFEIVMNKAGRVLTKDETRELCKGCAGIIAGTEEYDRDTLKKLNSLGVISRVGSGIDTIDVKSADELGIRIVNTPLAPALAVAEFTAALILDLLRKVSSMDRDIRSGKWKKRIGNMLYAKKAGVIGYGRIGRKVAGLLTALGCETAYCDPAINDYGGKHVAMRLTDLLKWADIVTLHASGNAEIIGKAELGIMKKGSWLVNISRGGKVDEDALYAALKSGHLCGAAIDVFAEEPYNGVLRELDNVVLTPHVGSYAIESRIEMETEAVKNLIKILNEVDR